MDEQADVVVLGMGVGGEDAAGKLAEAGLDVIGIDHRLVGGECPYWGCVPSKMMIRAANLLAEARRVAGMAGSATVQPDWAPVARRIREEATDNWNDKAAVERFEQKGGRFIRGTGTITGPRTVQVGEQTVRATRALVINTGTEPAVPPIDGLDSVPYWTNREAIETEAVPESLVVLGGGAIGLELAQMFSRFGARVTVVEALDRLLAMEEPEASSLVADVFEREGISVRTGAGAKFVSEIGGRITVELGDGSTVAATRLLVATGRRANLAAIGAGKAGLDETAKFIKVDERMRAGDGMWALGDVTGVGAFTHLSLYQSSRCVADILGQNPPPTDYRALPRVTFTDPEVGATGKTEKQARDDGINVRCGTAQVPESARGWIHKAGNDGFIKLVADADRNVLVGATSAGPVGGEVLSMLTLAVHAQIPIATLQNMMYAYPTFHRGVEDALRSLMS